MHPGIAPNVSSTEKFKEIQFFNGRNYYEGLDWYMNCLPALNNSTTKYLFEKSTTYFDAKSAPKRAQALLPHAKLVTIFTSPAKRAYKCYQQTRAHGDAIALNYSFYEIISATNGSNHLKDLRNRYLYLGKYAQHIERWLAYYPMEQLQIIDGDKLQSDPITVMADLQKFLNITPVYDYSQHLRYDLRKGVFCQVLENNSTKCSDPSKSRDYETIDKKSYTFLKHYYRIHNKALVKLLNKLGYQMIPSWLKDDLRDTVFF